MSSLPIQAVTGRPVAFSKVRDILQCMAAVPRLAEVTRASRLEGRPTPEMVPTGIRKLDAMTGGLPRGCLIEIFGPASSGRTSVLLAALSSATRRGEVCALVDVGDALDPLSAEKAGMVFEKLLWVRCGERDALPPKPGDAEKKTGPGCLRMETPVEQALRVTDLLLQSGGFGLVAIDLGDVSVPTARRVPLTSWFRFQRVVEHTFTVLMLVTQTPCAQTCAGWSLKLRGPERQPFIAGSRASEMHLPHAHLLENIQVEAELLRSRAVRKPAGAVTSSFFSKTAWAV
jgi:recA bacterial DNA recombination protein